MKNIKKIIVALALLLGTNMVVGQSLSQNKDRPEVIAKAKVEKLSESLDLNDDQERALFRAYVQKEVSYQKNVKGKDAKSAPVKAAMQKANDQLAAAVKKTLTAEQYKRWLDM